MLRRVGDMWVEISAGTDRVGCGKAPLKIIAEIGDYWC